MEKEMEKEMEKIELGYVLLSSVLDLIEAVKDVFSKERYTGGFIYENNSACLKKMFYLLFSRSTAHHWPYTSDSYSFKCDRTSSYG